MHLHLPFARAAPVRRAFLALAACAACAASAACATSQAGTPAAGPLDAADAPVSIAMPGMVEDSEASRRLGDLFPAAARKAGTTHGFAWLRFRVMADSTVDTASIVVERQTSPEFAQPAKEFIARARYRPATVGGRPVEAWIRTMLMLQDPRAEGPSFGMGRLEFDEGPVLLNATELPRLVPALRDAGVAGSVLVTFGVSRTGEPADIEVRLTTDPALEEAAIAVVRGLRYRPARLGSRAVHVGGWVTMPIHFGRVPAAR